MVNRDCKPKCKTYKIFVNGQWVDSSQRQNFPRLRSFDRRSDRQVPDADAKDVDAPSKPRAKPSTTARGRSTTAQDRGRVLFKLAEKIRQNAAAARRTRMPQLRQADRRSRIRHRRLSPPASSTTAASPPKSLAT